MQSSPTARRVLIVEDDIDSQQALAELIEMWGHQVFVASDGPSGVDAALSNAPDIAFVDIGLPVIDGCEVARRVRSAPEGQHVVLVALTGYGDSEQKARSLASGFDAHLVKPCDIDRLVELIDQLPRERAKGGAAARPKVRTAASSVAPSTLRVVSCSADETTRAAVARALRLTGLDAIEAATLDEAHKSASRPDAIVISLTAGWHRPEGLRDALVVGLTSIAASSADRAAALEAGADAVLAPSVDAEELAATIRALVRVRAERGAIALAAGVADSMADGGQALSVLSHELKTPLTSLQMQLDSLSRGLKRADLYAQFGQKIEGALRQTARLSALVDELGSKR